MGDADGDLVGSACGASNVGYENDDGKFLSSSALFFVGTSEGGVGASKLSSTLISIEGTVTLMFVSVDGDPTYIMKEQYGVVLFVAL